MQYFPGEKNVTYYLENMLLSHSHPSENNLADFLKQMLESITHIRHMCISNIHDLIDTRSILILVLQSWI
jgi:hypothetical protein